jgi:hypothetical protein
MAARSRAQVAVAVWSRETPSPVPVPRSQNGRRSLTVRTTHVPSNESQSVDAVERTVMPLQLLLVESADR